jgi:hypothetical protein
VRTLLLFSLVATCFAQERILTLDEWRVNDGDNPAWSKPEFDDSGWAGSAGPVRGTFDDVYPGVRWFRTSVTLPPQLQATELALGFGWLNECYQVFVEGQLIGQFGRWDRTCSSPTPRDRTFPIPTAVSGRGGIHIALRCWLNGPAAAWLALSAAARPSRHSPLIGERILIQTTENLHTASSQLQSIPWDLTYLLALLAGGVSIAFYTVQKRQIEHLLFGLYCICFGVPLLAIPLLGGESVGQRSPIAVIVLALFIAPVPLAVLILSRLCPRYRLVLRISAGIVLVGAMGAPWTLATGSVVAIQLYLLHLRILPLPYLIALWGLRHDRALGTKIVAATLSLFSVADGYGRFLPLRFFPAGPFSVDIRAIGQLIFVFTMLIVLYRRFREDQVRQSLADEDLAAARRIQEMLLAPGAGQTNGFAVEAVYRPAREVGGDFHQEIAGEDGSLLVVVGDVSGKGLPAAMLVSTVVGALGDLVDGSGW